MRSTAPYSTLQISLHWATVVALVVQVWTSPAIARTHHAVHLGNAVEAYDIVLHNIHAVVGGLAFLFAATRLLLRWRFPPTPSPSLSGWQERAALIVHYGLYAVLLALPLTGFVRMYFLSVAGPIHIGLTRALYVLLFIHIAAALWHGLVRRDDVISRMGLNFLRQKDRVL